jgi:hypothetical protein
LSHALFIQAAQAHDRGVDHGRQASELSDSMHERPKTEIEPIDPSRLREDVRIKIDAWIAAQPEPRPSRSQAIQHLLAEALAKEADARAILAAAAGNVWAVAKSPDLTASSPPCATIDDALMGANIMLGNGAASVWIVMEPMTALHSFLFEGEKKCSYH